ncbi:MAG: diguanylate cyclase [Deltaproteobacteria bacterium]|nr:diguanylate cyclase [Deltaproteobacteria bacterium]
MTALTILLVTEDPALVTLVRDSVAPWGDHVIVESAPIEAIDRGEGEDAVLVDLALSDGAGLAVAHFLAARSDSAPVLALSTGRDGDGDGVAQALGVQQVLARPLTGDDLLVALGTIRKARAMVETPSVRRESHRPGELMRDLGVNEIAQVLDASDLTELTERIAHAAFLLTGHGARVRIENARFETLEAAAGPPSTSVYDEIELASREDTLGTLYVTTTPLTRPKIEHLVRSAAAVGVLLRNQDAAARAGIKDPETSAYTFAYFVDAAGREVERALRHQRRFGLMTFQIEDWSEQRERLGEHAVREARREMVDTILDTAADTDVLALVEDDELYLLSPESGRLRGLALRRRITEKHRRRATLAKAEQRASLSVAIGFATFPRDGRDLATLARAAASRGRRAEEHSEVWHGEHNTLDAVLGALLRLRPQSDDWALRQCALSSEAAHNLGLEVAREALRTAGPADGVAYLIGERVHPLVAGAFEAMRRAPSGALPCYWLRPNPKDGHEPSAPGVRLLPIEIEVDSGRVGPFATLAVLTESWAYACVSSAQGSYKRIMHTSDLELVEALVAEVQKTFHLQREGN